MPAHPNLFPTSPQELQLNKVQGRNLRSLPEPGCVSSHWETPLAKKWREKATQFGENWKLSKNEHVEDRKGTAERFSHHHSYTWLLSDLIRRFWFRNLNHHHLLLLLFLYGSELNLLSRMFSWRNGAYVNDCLHGKGADVKGAGVSHSQAALLPALTSRCSTAAVISLLIWGHNGMVNGQAAALVPLLLCTVPEEFHMPRLRGSCNLALLPYGAWTIPFLQLHNIKPRLRMALSPEAGTAWLLLAMGCWAALVPPGCRTNLKDQSNTVPAPSGRCLWCTGMLLFPWILTVHRDAPLFLALNTLWYRSCGPNLGTPFSMPQLFCCYQFLLKNLRDEPIWLTHLNSNLSIALRDTEKASILAKNLPLM